MCVLEGIIGDDNECVSTFDAFNLELRNLFKDPPMLQATVAREKRHIRLR